MSPDDKLQTKCYNALYFRTHLATSFKGFVNTKTNVPTPI